MDKRGVVLLSVIMILLTVAIIGASLVAFFSSVSMSAGTVADAAKALYLAEAGVSRAVNMLRTEAGAGGMFEERIGPVSLGEGTYTVEFDIIQSMITSTGEVHGTRKTVQLQYSAL